MMTVDANDPTFHEVDSLTAREREVLELFAQGLENKIVAIQLSVSEETVKTHAKNIYRKLRVRNRVQAVLVLKP